MAFKLYGLLGKDLSHSFSERYFREKFAREGIADAPYHNFPIAAIADLPRLLEEHPDLAGFNVTIPYKESVMPYLSEIKEDAARIGAVNCVVVEPARGGGVCDGGTTGRSKMGGPKLTGYNTDAPAFRASLLGFIGPERPSALVLGSGGASKAVCHVLKGLGISYTVVSRTPHTGALAYPEVTETVIADNLLIINTTPVSPDIPYDALTSGHFLFDLVYNPDPTEFLMKGCVRGAKTLNGMEMLIGQAERSWEIWRACALL